MRLLQASPTLDGDGSVLVYPLYVNQIILPFIDRGKLVQGRHTATSANYSIPTFPPTRLIVALNDVHI